MEREAFRQRMQQYKQARENNPQLKYWDWKKYADGGIVDEDPPQNTSERPITNFIRILLRKQLCSLKIQTIT